MSKIHCILCSEPLRYQVGEVGHGERPETLVCGAHSDQDLRDLGLDELWRGVDPNYSSAFFTGGTSRLIGAWEQGEGEFGVYLLLDDGQLLLITCWSPDVSMARVPLRVRGLVEPKGVPQAQGREWHSAVHDRWTLREAEKIPDGDVVLRFAEGWVVRFSTQYYSWRELGDGRYFLTQTWQSTGGYGDES